MYKSVYVSLRFAVDPNPTLHYRSSDHPDDPPSSSSATTTLSFSHAFVSWG